ncbi:MAG: amidohydrolase family protein, partial [Acidobacteriaceae bacterium]|nr:amidohydrolase family protein [Acidobacteriaceae bacterium]
MKRVLILCMLASAAVFLRGAEQASLILYNGRVWTGDSARPAAQAIAIAGNRILAVGDDAQMRALEGPRTATLDVEGRRVVPGFIDAHVHFFQGGSALTGPQLRYAKSPQEFRDTLGEFAKHYPRGRWITGGEWDHENWSPAHLPDRRLIDSVTRDWPVWVERLDGHMALANSVALKLAGIDRNTKDVPGGIIVRDESGEPTGILKDAAQELVERVIPPPTQQEIVDVIRASQVHANALGITSVDD